MWRWDEVKGGAGATEMGHAWGWDGWGVERDAKSTLFADQCHPHPCLC